MFRLKCTATTIPEAYSRSAEETARQEHIKGPSSNNNNNYNLGRYSSGSNNNLDYSMTLNYIPNSDIVYRNIEIFRFRYIEREHHMDMCLENGIENIKGIVK